MYEKITELYLGNEISSDMIVRTKAFNKALRKITYALLVRFLAGP